MHTEKKEERYVFHFDANIFEEGIEESEYEELYDFIEKLKKKYGPKAISMRTSKRTNYSKLEIIVNKEKAKLKD